MRKLSLPYRADINGLIQTDRLLYACVYIAPGGKRFSHYSQIAQSYTSSQQFCAYLEKKIFAENKRFSQTSQGAEIIGEKVKKNFAGVSMQDLFPIDDENEVKK